VRVLLALLFTLTVASAAPVLTVTVSPALQSGVPGQTLVFPGTLENITTGTVFINSNALTFDIAGIGVLDDSLFLSNAPFSLNSLEATKPFDFFSVSIPALQAPGLYSGVLTVLGGADGSAADVLGTGTFQVQVNAPASTSDVPEPATVLLMGGGLALLLWQRRR
jgi:hypothetical protein